MTLRLRILTWLLEHGQGYGLELMIELRTSQRIYKLLHKLEHEDLARSWEANAKLERGRPRRYYALTELGRKIASGAA